MYDYSCPECGLTVECRTTLAERDNQRCQCGALLRRLPHYRSVSVSIPVHMRASFDKTLYEIAPPEPELRKEWHDAGVAQGIIKKPKSEAWEV